MSLASVLRANPVGSHAAPERSFADYMAEQEALEQAERAAAAAAEATSAAAAASANDATAPSPRIRLARGESLASVRSAEDIEEQIDRLDMWEEQLQNYSDQLTEQGWTLWKRSAVTSVMNQLQRQVVPDAWRGEMTRMEQEIAALKDRVSMGADKERALLSRLDEVENGPGCARELREKLAAAELDLERQQARERQQSVFKQLLSSGTVSDNAGGGAPALRRRQTIATATVAGGGGGGPEAPGLARNQSAPGATGVGLRRRATSCSSAGGTIAEDGGAEDDDDDDSCAAVADGTASAEGGAEGGAEVEELRVRLAKAERLAMEAQQEMQQLRASTEERSSALEAALDAERKAHRHAVETLESTHVEAGMHEAQEMVQLRIELTAAQEELDFLRSRQVAPAPRSRSHIAASPTTTPSQQAPSQPARSRSRSRAFLTPTPHPWRAGAAARGRAPPPDGGRDVQEARYQCLQVRTRGVAQAARVGDRGGGASSEAQRGASAGC